MPSQNSVWLLWNVCRALRGRGFIAATAGLAVLLIMPGWAAPAPKPVERTPPQPIREARGAWIATVANLDWPSKPGISTSEQKAELTAIFDKAVELHLNLLILQVRPACDALYSSRFDPWSEFLSGQMGKAPEPYYDPLAFAVEEAHRRGLELHAWFNPFRVRAANPKTGLATNHISRTHPEWVRAYGSQQWLDPGLNAVRERSMLTIVDVVKRYDIDGVHLDDYFYPYPEKNSAGQYIDFPDDVSWQKYRSSGGKLNRGDWRRKNMDDFVEELSRRIKAEKGWVKFGISPFGIWRPGNPPQIKKGLDAYDWLYADSRKWLANGWVDYLAPQLYWSIDGPDQSYPVLLQWWAGQNAKSRHVWPGNDLTKVGGAWPASEIVKQIKLTRRQKGASGNLLWNISSLVRNQDALGYTLAHGLYAQPALLPPSPWLKQELPPKPQLQIEPGNPAEPIKLSLRVPTEKPVWLWLCQSRCKGHWTSVLVPGDKLFWALPRRNSPWFPDRVAVTAVNRCSGAGPTALLDLNPDKR
jgi:uncharacterized lipoprotein YddW (UPF0748 family)